MLPVVTEQIPVEQTEADVPIHPVVTEQSAQSGTTHEPAQASASTRADTVSSQHPPAQRTANIRVSQKRAFNDRASTSVTAQSPQTAHDPVVTEQPALQISEATAPALSQPKAPTPTLQAEAPTLTLTCLAEAPAPTLLTTLDQNPKRLVWTPLIEIKGGGNGAYHSKLSHAYSSIAKHSSKLRDERGLLLEKTIRERMQVKPQYRHRFAMSSFERNCEYIKKGQK